MIEIQENKPRLPSFQNHLFAIGIDNYAYCTDLNNAVDDARLVVSLLVEKYDFHQVKTLYNEAASYANILNQLENYTQSLTETDTILIYFAGHGYYRESNKMGYIVPYDGDNDSTLGYITTHEILNFVKSLKAFHTFLVVDSCFSGSFVAANRDIDHEPLHEKSLRAINISSNWILTSGLIEKVSDGFVNNNSPFASAFVESMSQNTYMLYPVSEVIRDVENKLTKNQNKQTPIGGSLNFEDYELSIGGQYVFIRKQNLIEMDNNNSQIVGNDDLQSIQENRDLVSIVNAIILE
jgi:Caspase domain